MDYDKTSHPDAAKMSEILYSFYYIQSVSEPTQKKIHIFTDICDQMTRLSMVTPLPTAYPASQLPYVFRDGFTSKISDIQSYLDLMSMSSNITYNALRGFSLAEF